MTSCPGSSRAGEPEVSGLRPSPRRPRPEPGKLLADLVDQALRPPAVPSVVVRNSTPVVAFGDPRGAPVVTLGLNPSTRQFLHQNGVLRDGAARRLATLPWLGLRSWDEMDDAAAAAVVGECLGYFGPDRLPYRRWFDPFDRVLRAGAGASYYEGTACHLNLVSWATDPVWRGLETSEWRSLVEAERPYLVEQLGWGDHRLVVVNGRTAMTEVEEAGLVTWTPDARLDGPPSTVLCLGQAGGVLYAGWTCNLQNQPGAARLAGELSRWLRGVVATEWPGGQPPFDASAARRATTANCG